MKQFLLAIGLMTGLGATAQWNGDSTVNNPVATGTLTGTRSGLVAISDGAGGMWLAWENTAVSADGSDIFLQKVNANGSLLFSNPGLAVCNAVGSQTNIAMASDGVGGVILTWQDARTTGDNDIYGQRVNAAGTALWTANGVALGPVANTQTTPQIARLNATEAAVVYRNDDGSATSINLIASKIDIANGAVLLNKLVAVGTNNQTNQQIASDSANGLFIVFEDRLSGNTTIDVRAQRVNNTMDTLWTGTDATGVPVSTAAATQINPRLVVHAGTTAGTFVATVAFSDTRTSATNSEIFIQQLSNTGARLLTPADGVQVTTAANNQLIPKLVRSSATSMVLAWEDQRIGGTGSRDIYASSVSLTGAIGWAANGVAVVAATGNQPNNTNSGWNIVADEQGGAIIAWDDARVSTSNLDIRAQRLNGSGTPLWTSDGTAVAITASSNQASPVLVADGAGGAIIAWRDSRNGTGAEIYASRTNATGILLPIQFVSISASKDGNQGLIRWQVAGEQGTVEYVVEESADGSRFTTLGRVKANGSERYSLPDALLNSGANYYRVKAVSNSGRNTISEIVRLDVEGVTQIKLWPNPAKDYAVVGLQNAAPGQYQIQLVDVQGRVLSTDRFDLATQSSLNRNVKLAGLSAGHYLVVLRNAAGIVNTMAVVKE